MVKDIIYQLSSVPRTWWLPRRDRAILAVISIIFWSATIQHALFYSAANASVFSLFGLGLLYLVFSLFNLADGMKLAIQQHARGSIHESHPRALIELFMILAGMFICNIVVLAIYVLKGTSFTIVDAASLGVIIVLLLFLMFTYGYEQILRHPISRGWLAIAGKTVPQLITAALFIIHPSAASGLALVTLLGIDALSLLRFIPTLKAFLRDRYNHHIRGLLLGEAGNTISGLILTSAWVIAQFLL
jgi:hypothetical protein